MPTAKTGLNAVNFVMYAIHPEVPDPNPDPDPDRFDFITDMTLSHICLQATNSVDFQVMQPGSSVATSLNEVVEEFLTCSPNGFPPYIVFIYRNEMLEAFTELVLSE